MKNECVVGGAIKGSDDRVDAWSSVERLVQTLGESLPSGLSVRLHQRFGSIEALLQASEHDLLSLGVDAELSRRMEVVFSVLRSIHVGRSSSVCLRSSLVSVLDRSVATVPPGQNALFAFLLDGTRRELILNTHPSSGRDLPLGAYLIKMLRLSAGPWCIAMLRPGGEPTVSEISTARRWQRMARLLGVDLVYVAVASGRRRWIASADVSEHKCFGERASDL